MTSAASRPSSVSTSFWTASSPANTSSQKNLSGAMRSRSSAVVMTWRTPTASAIKAAIGAVDVIVRSTLWEVSITSPSRAMRLKPHAERRIATSVEIRPFRNGWQVFEAPAVEPVFLNQEQAIDYARCRACFRAGEIRILDAHLVRLRKWLNRSPHKALAPYVLVQNLGRYRPGLCK